MTHEQQVALLGTEGVEVEFTDDAIDQMAQLAFEVNRRTQNIGARRLYTILEKSVRDDQFRSVGADGKARQDHPGIREGSPG